MVSMRGLHNKAKDPTECMALLGAEQLRSVYYMDIRERRTRLTRQPDLCASNLL
jgi:hypothetical protein